MARIVLALLLCLGLGSCGKAPVEADSKPVLRAWLPYNGESMVPTLPKSGFVEIEFEASFDSLKVGDVVVFWDYKRGKESFTLHRLIEKQSNAFIAKGDNAVTNPVADPSWVTRDTFYGRWTGRYANAVFNGGN